MTLPFRPITKKLTDTQMRHYLHYLRSVLHTRQLDSDLAQSHAFGTVMAILRDKFEKEDANYKKKWTGKPGKKWILKFNESQSRALMCVLVELKIHPDDLQQVILREISEMILNQLPHAK